MSTLKDFRIHCVTGVNEPRVGLSYTDCNGEQAYDTHHSHTHRRYSFGRGSSGV